MKTLSPVTPLLNSESVFRRMFSKFCTEVRHGIALAGEKYQYGILPPL